MSAPDRHIHRNRNSVDFVHEIHTLKDGGYSIHQIAEKAHCCDAYVRSMLYLLKHGDSRLIAEIERGHIPHTVAIELARFKGPDVQSKLIEGYKAGAVKVAQIAAIRQRMNEHESNSRNRGRNLEADFVIRSFSNETNRQKLLIRKAKRARSRLAFIVDALKQLFSERRFVPLLHAEGIHTMPSLLVDCIKASTK